MVTDRAFAEEIGFLVDLRVGAGEARLVLAGELDLATAPAFFDALADALDPRPAQVVLDLARLTFIDARSAGAIAAAAARMAGWSGTLAVAEPARPIRRVFELCGLADLLGPPVAARAA